jgi:hypothetical protein
MAAYVQSMGKRLPGGVAGEALAIGEIVFMASDGQWELADANAAGEKCAQGVVTMKAAGALSDVEVCDSAVIGGLSGLTVGADIYLAETPGVPTETRPADAYDAIQAIGYNLSATVQVINIAPQAYLRPS